MKDKEIIKIVLIANGYNYAGPIISEDKDYITILDVRSNSHITFPKIGIIIQRSAQ